ncbi:orotidine-5'-phosphate decarboxylase [Candidatus Kaiserbacteria bacterium]|nr:orotidine-5'-phosphate decarboxylase [Candidatus Kaiserbacteria bacterium]
MRLLDSRWEQGLFLCVGLDPGYEKIPQSVRSSSVEETFLTFNKAIIDATKDIVCAFKPNPAFYEAQGIEGWKALQSTVDYIHAVAPDVPVILDAKRGDIGNTNVDYAKMAFDNFGADAITVQPYAGGEALEPFLDRSDKGVFVLVRTSNGGAREFQDLEIGGKKLYEIVSGATVGWNKNGNVGVVVGTTYPKEIGEVRAIVGDMPILMPGVGAQGGDLEESVRLGKNSKGKGFIINVSRAVIFASQKDDFAEAARAKSQELHSAIQKAL